MSGELPTTSEVLEGLDDIERAVQECRAAVAEDPGCVDPDRTMAPFEDLNAASHRLASSVVPASSQHPLVGEAGEEKTARQQVDAILDTAALASAPEYLWDPNSVAEEAAWLKGRDDTVEHVRGDLADLPDSLSHRQPHPALSLEQRERLERIAASYEYRAAAQTSKFAREQEEETATFLRNLATGGGERG